MVPVSATTELFQSLFQNLSILASYVAFRNRVPKINVVAGDTVVKIVPKYVREGDMLNLIRRFCRYFGIGWGADSF